MQSKVPKSCIAEMCLVTVYDIWTDSPLLISNQRISVQKPKWATATKWKTRTDSNWIFMIILSLVLALNKFQSNPSWKPKFWFLILKIWLSKEKQSAFLENLSIPFDYHYSPSMSYLWPKRLKNHQVFLNFCGFCFQFLLLAIGSHLFFKMNFRFHQPVKQNNQSHTGQSDHSIVVRIQPIKMHRGKIVSFDRILYNGRSGRKMVLRADILLHERWIFLRKAVLTNISS